MTKLLNSSRNNKINDEETLRANTDQNNFQ